MTDTHRRRSFLAGAGAVAVALAGCASLPGGSGGNGDGGDGTDADGNGPTDSGEAKTGSGNTPTGTDTGPTAPEEIAGSWPAPGGKPGRTFRMRGVSGSGPSPPFGRVWTNGDLDAETSLLGPGGRLYGYDSSGGNGAITAVDAGSGARKWAAGVDGSGGVGAPLWTGTDALVCSLGALDPGDGSRMWTRTDADEFSGRAAGPTGVYGVVPGEEAPLSLRKLDAASGDEVWTRLPAGVDRASPRFVANGRLYARAATGDGVATLALDAETGRRSFLDTRGEPLAAGPQYRFLHDAGTVTAVARGAGDAVWSLDVGRQHVAVDRDRVYHVTRSGATLVAREKGSGSSVWRAPLKPHDPGSLFVAGGRVYVGGTAGTGTPSGTQTVVSQAFTREGGTAWTVEGFVAAFVTEKMVFGVVPQSPESVVMAAFVSA